MEENENKTAEEKKIEKGNTNKLLIIFFLVLFILLFTGVIVMTVVNNSLKAELEELKAITMETEKDLNSIRDDVNAKIENTIENIVNSEIENTVDNTAVVNEVKNETKKEDKKITSNKDVYEALELKFSNFNYRREKGESAGFFIKDKTVYSGEESDKTTHAKTEGIKGTPKYIVPINKQLGKTIVLTEEGKAYVNVPDEGLGIYGTKFEAYLEEYKFIEIMELGEVYKLYLITNDARVFDIETGKEFVD